PGDVGREVTLCGWVHARRDHGGVLFVDLRDRTGVVQVVCNPAESPAAHERARDVRLEFVIAVRGTVRPRPGETVNPDLPTGAVEVVASALHVLNTARPTPFPIDDAAEVTESTRLRYRYLDLRRPAVQRNLLLRHEVAHAVREHLTRLGFIEVETPVLARSTPEGARDYLVPGRDSASSATRWRWATPCAGSPFPAAAGRCRVASSTTWSASRPPRARAGSRGSGSVRTAGSRRRRSSSRRPSANASRRRLVSRPAICSSCSPSRSRWRRPSCRASASSSASGSDGWRRARTAFSGSSTSRSSSATRTRIATPPSITRSRRRSTRTSIASRATLSGFARRPTISC